METYTLFVVVILLAVLILIESLLRVETDTVKVR